MGFRERYSRARAQVDADEVAEREALARDPRKRRRQAVLGLGVVCLLALLLLGTVVASRQREQPLLATGLPTATAEVVRMDTHRRRTDDVEVRYDAAGSGVTADIPTSERFRAGERVQVAYEPADPTHVRLVEGWAPWYSSSDAAFHGVLLLVLACVCVASGIGAQAQLRREGG